MQGRKMELFMLLFIFFQTDLTQKQFLWLSHQFHKKINVYNVIVLFLVHNIIFVCLSRQILIVLSVN